MNPTLGTGLHSSTSKRPRSTDSQRSSSNPPALKASKTEDDGEVREGEGDASVPAFLRQTKAGKLHTRG